MSLKCFWISRSIELVCEGEGKNADIAEHKVVLKSHSTDNINGWQIRYVLYKYNYTVI